MELQSQVSNLETSQKLKELGVPQKSLFWYEKIDRREWEIELGVNAYVLSYVTDEPVKTTDVSAFTVAELGEMLTGDRDWFSGKCWGEDIFGCNAHRGRDYVERVEADTEADARAKMLIYLIQNGLVDVKSLII